jgi:hypothetical protein
MFFITYFPPSSSNYPLEVANMKSIWNQTHHFPEIQDVSKQGNYSVLMYRHMYSGLAPEFYSEMWILVTTLQPDQYDQIHAYVLRFQSTAEALSNQITFKKSYNQTSHFNLTSLDEGKQIIGPETPSVHGPFMMKSSNYIAMVFNSLTREVMIAATSNDLGYGELLHPETGDPRDI